MPHRLFATLMIAGLALCAVTASVAPAAATPTVTLGHALVIKVKTKPGSLCSPVVTYANHTMQSGTTKKVPARGQLTWSLLVPHTASVGAGSWYVRCAWFNIVGKGKFLVVAQKTTTSVENAPRVVADKQGFSQRPASFGTGSTLSYGMFLRNTSATRTR